MAFLGFIGALTLMAAITTEIISTGASTAPLPTNILRARVVASDIRTSSVTLVTYYYRNTNGSRGSTTDSDAVPNGAVVELTI